MATHCKGIDNLIPHGNDFYLAIALKSRSLVDGEVVETPFDFEAADTYNARIYSILDGKTLSTMVGLKDGSTDTVIIDAKGVPLIRAIGVEVTGEVDGRAFRAAEKGFLSIVEFNGEAHVVFTPVTGGQEANLVMTLTFLPSAAVVGKNAYEIWKEEPGNQDKTLADFIYFLGHGESAYEIAVRYGYTGTEAEYNMLYFDAVDVANTAGQNAQQAADTANEMAAQAQDAAELADAATTNANNAATAAAAAVDAAIDNMEDTLNAAIAAQDAEIEEQFATQTALINQKQMEIGAVPSDLTPTAGSAHWVTSGGIFYFTNPIKVDLYGGGVDTPINLSGYSPTNGYIGGTGAWTSSNSVKCLMIPVAVGAQYFNITANSSTNSSYAFLKSTTISGTSVDYATGYSNRIRVEANESATNVSIPSDANFLYLYYGTSGESLPSSASFVVYSGARFGDKDYNDATYQRKDAIDITNLLTWNNGYNIWAHEGDSTPVGALHQTSAPHAASDYYAVNEGEVLELTMISTKSDISVGLCFYGSENQSDVVLACCCPFVGYSSSYEYSVVRYVVPKGAKYFRTTKITTVSGFYAKILPLINYEPVNAKLLGAVGDGVTDDTASLQEIIDSNSYIYIPSGTYLIHTTIIIGEGKRIVGDGYGSTVFKLASSFNLQGYAWRGNVGASTLHSTISPMVSIVGSNVIIEGIGTNDGRTFTESYGATRAGFLVDGSNNARLNNCGATDINTVDPDDGAPANGECAGFGVFILSSTNVIIDGGRYYNCGYECVGAESSSHVYVENVDIDTGWRCACQVHRDAYNVHFENCRIVQNLGSNSYTSAAVILDGRSTDGLWDIFICGCWIYARTPQLGVIDGGIKCVLANEANITIRGNKIDVNNYAISDQNNEQTMANHPYNWIISENNIVSLNKGICLERILRVVATNNIIDCPNEAVKVKTGSVVANNIFVNNSTVTYL